MATYLLIGYKADKTSPTIIPTEAGNFDEAFALAKAQFKEPEYAYGTASSGPVLPEHANS